FAWDGQIGVGFRPGLNTARGFSAGPLSRGHPLHFLPRFQRVGGWDFFLPLWIPVLLAILPSLWIRWMAAAGPPSRCAICGYDLAGNTTGICPECGAETPTRDPRNKMSDSSGG